MFATLIVRMTQTIIFTLHVSLNYLINYPLKDQFRYMDYGYCRLESYTTGTANFSYLCEIVIVITLRLGSVRSSP